MSIWCIYSSGSIRVHKHLLIRLNAAPNRKHFVCVSICIWMACEGCLSMAFNVIKLIGVDFDDILIFYSFNDVFVSSWVYRIFV